MVNEGYPEEPDEGVHPESEELIRKDVSRQSFRSWNPHYQAMYLQGHQSNALKLYKFAKTEALYGILGIENPKSGFSYIQGLVRGEVERRHDRSEWHRTWWTIGFTLLGFVIGGFISAWAQSFFVSCPQ